MIPFTWPVFDHWAMNLARDRLAMLLVAKSEMGITASAMRASRIETSNIITRTPMIVSTDVSNWLSDCWRLCEMLSMSLVTRLSRSPREF